MTFKILQNANRPPRNRRSLITTITLNIFARRIRATTSRSGYVYLPESNIIQHRELVKIFARSHHVSSNKSICEAWCSSGAAREQSYVLLSSDICWKDLGVANVDIYRS